MPKRVADAASMNETVTKKTGEIEKMVEGKSYTNTKEMDDILKGEANAKCLSKSKVCYNRRGDEDDTLVFRELYPDAKYDRFGVKGIEKLNWMFYFLLGIMSEKQEKIKDDEDRSRLAILFSRLNQEDRDEMKKAMRERDQFIPSTVRIGLTNMDTYPQVKLMQCNDQGLVTNGIYLFVNEAVRAIRHMNTIFKFSESPSLLPLETVPIEKCQSDDFF